MQNPVAIISPMYYQVLHHPPLHGRVISNKEAGRNFKRSLVQQHFCCTGLPVGVFLGLAVGECEKKLSATRDICTWEGAPEAIHLPWLEVRIK